MSYVPDTHLLYKDIEGDLALAVSYSQIETFLQCPYKWYRTYILGERSIEKQEATSYGTVIHETLEYFFKNKRKPNGRDLGDAITYYSWNENIPWSSPEEMLIAAKQSGELLAWLVELFEKENGWYKKPDSELNAVEKILRYADIEGVEESFNLPYKLVKPANINGREFENVTITGSIDLHLSITTNQGIKHHYVIDWKSGKKLFDNKKLEENLQHPIYAFYVYRKYGRKLPDIGIYFFTRTREYQKVKVDDSRVTKSISIMNLVFDAMYDFETKPVEWYASYREKPEGGYARYKTPLPSPVARNQKPCPSALCYFCDFGMHKRGVCPYSSDWDLSKKKK